MKEFLKDALTGLYLIKDTDDRRGHSTGFAAAVLLGFVGFIAVIAIKIITHGA